MEINLETGARAGIERICEAYGFTSRNQLAQHLGITNSSLGSRILRDNFPADIAVKCSLETGASLHWLVTGEGKVFETVISDTIRIPSFRLDGSTMVRQLSYIYDKALLPEYKGEINIINDEKIKYLIDIADYKLTDGKYFIEYSDTKSIKDLTILPGNKLRIDWGKYPIDCELSDVRIIGKVLATYLVNE